MESTKVVKEKPHKKDDGKNKKKKSNRCCICRKKNLTNIQCKCGQIVCMTHRYADSHKCTFNHALYEKKILSNNLQKVVASKIEVV